MHSSSSSQPTHPLADSRVEAVWSRPGKSVCGHPLPRGPSLGVGFSGSGEADEGDCRHDRHQASAEQAPAHPETRAALRQLEVASGPPPCAVSAQASPRPSPFPK